MSRAATAGHQRGDRVAGRAGRRHDAIVGDVHGQSHGGKSRAIWQRYAGGNDTSLWLAGADLRTLGLIGLQPHPGGVVEILHLAVLPECQHQGIARTLIQRVAATYPDCTLKAETDRDAVGFYLRCGFVATSLGEIYPGAERFALRREAMSRL